MNFIFTRPTFKLSGEKQFKAICDTFGSEWDNPSLYKRYTEHRLKTERFEQMLAELSECDTVFVYNPAIFGIGVEQAVENIRAVLAKGVAIRSVLYGDISEEWADQIEVAGEIVRECCYIEQDQEYHRNKGIKEEVGGYFEDGIWYNGQRRAYRPPSWAWKRAQRKVDKAQELRNRAIVMWIDMKIMQAWTTERIWAEYKDLCKVMPDLDRIGKQWINTRRLELIK